MKSLRESLDPVRQVKPSVKTGVIVLLVLLGTATATSVVAREYVYHAYCEKPHGLGPSYYGDDRATEDAAKADCKEHEKEWTDHSCKVRGRNK